MRNGSNHTQSLLEGTGGNTSQHTPRRQCYLDNKAKDISRKNNYGLIFLTNVDANTLFNTLANQIHKYVEKTSCPRGVYPRNARLPPAGCAHCHLSARAHNEPPPLLLTHPADVSGDPTVGCEPTSSQKQTLNKLPRLPLSTESGSADAGTDVRQCMKCMTQYTTQCKTVSCTAEGIQSVTLPGVRWAQTHLGHHFISYTNV